MLTDSVNLVSWPRSPLHNSSVIPGKLAIRAIAAERDPESSEIANLDAGLRRHDDEETADFFVDFWVRTLAVGDDPSHLELSHDGRVANGVRYPTSL